MGTNILENKELQAGELKEIRLSPFIAEQDYQTRLKRISKFLAEGNKVRAVVVFKGRHMGSKPFGYKLLNKPLFTPMGMIVGLGIMSIYSLISGATDKDGVKQSFIDNKIINCLSVDKTNYSVKNDKWSLVEDEDENEYFINTSKETVVSIERCEVK